MKRPLGQRWNGAELPASPDAMLATSRGLHYGDGVFRTLLKFDGRILDLDLQLAKLAHDAQRLGLEMPIKPTLIDDAMAVSDGHPKATIKLLLCRQGHGRGYRSDAAAVDRLVIAYALPIYPIEHWSEGICAFRAAIALADQPALAGLKHLNRLEQVLASRDWQDGAEEGILCGPTGNPVCGTRSNLFWVAQGQLHTPSLGTSGVAGMMRDRVIDAATAAGLTTTIAAMPWSELMNADEVFVTNSLIGIWPLRRLESRSWTAPGRITTMLSETLAHPKLIGR